MAATKTSNWEEHFRLEKLKEWPEPESVSLMEVLAREDIDEAVHAILFRENYIVKKLDTYFQHLAIFKERRKELLHKKWVENVAEPLQKRIIEKVISYRGAERKHEKFEYYVKHTNKSATVSPFCDCLFRRWQEASEKKRTSYQYGTGKQYDVRKGLYGTEKAGVYTKSSQFTSQGTIPKKRQRSSARSLSSKTGGVCSTEKLIYAAKQHLPQEEISDLSQMAFERQFRSSRLSPENKEAEKKILATRPQRPWSWAPGDSRRTQGPPPVGRRVMTAEVLGKHLASLQGAGRSGHQ